MNAPCTCIYRGLFCVLTSIKISFAGRKGNTTAIDNTYSPKWMEELHLPLMLPSMCDKVKLQVWHHLPSSSFHGGFALVNKYAFRFTRSLLRPRAFLCRTLTSQIFDSDMGIIGNSDDLVATQFLNMKYISSLDPDFGFLPTFGPCFVNFYGAPREFSMFNSSFSEVHSSFCPDTDW